MDSEARRPAYWRLVAVLASTLPLTPSLAMWLYDAALELHHSQGGVAELAGELGEGQITNLQQELLLGSISGPGFEAKLDTPDGRGLIRFVVTREGLAVREERAPATVN